MRFDILYALRVFCFVSAITPGPNNLMLLASGANFGFRRTIPHMLGVGLGFGLMVGLVGIGLDATFSRFPTLLPMMRYLGAAAFQWINPKAWVIAVSALTAFAVSENYTRSIVIVALVFGVVTMPCIAAWVLFGTAMRRVLSNPRFVRPFNIAMALLLIASIVPVLTEG
jgi:threonine/homoserine/homoserine lactone efflux protein